ncbi:MAG: EscU/YscU/HrcU family type III secretion system export apparatus switch protein [Candidatus Lernaella stagnicola]|nr:EscU/YscU/HrcU family type III secretion system export apparatus switch protein [Candidatus Lernaella stagnicola]
MSKKKEKKVDRKAAAAIKYDPGKDGAPRVTAKGMGVVAEKIIEKAIAAGVPLREDPDLAAALARMPLGEEIPPALYQAVAEVLAFVYRMNGRGDV